MKIYTGTFGPTHAATRTGEIYFFGHAQQWTDKWLGDVCTRTAESLWRATSSSNGNGAINLYSNAQKNYYFRIFFIRPAEHTLRGNVEGEDGAGAIYSLQDLGTPWGLLRHTNVVGKVLRMIVGRSILVRNLPWCSFRGSRRKEALKKLTPGIV